MMKRANEKIILALLMLLALNNLAFFIVGSYSGPIWGFLAALAVAFHWRAKKEIRLVVVIAVLWISLHGYELIVIGAGSHPLLFYLNVFLPILLLFCGLKERRRQGLRLK